ncbi:hypothetical protein KC338_g2897 [Hortaea werneckii]|nr:hypothetical protein KC338_g2897 [Hortaea werneckii]
MSFLFKSSKKSSGSGSGTPSTALPPATREIRSSDGPGSQQSQIPTRNGATKPGSPTPGQKGSVSNSLSSIAESGSRSGSAPPQETKQAEFMRQNGGLAGDLGNGMAGGAGMGMARQGALSPEQKTLRDKNQDQQLGQRLPAQQGRSTPQDASPYPWSQKRLTFTVSHTNPFPRYGPAVNATSSKDGSIYLMGGLINGSTVKGDLWMVEAGVGGSMTCYPVATTSEGPGPRVGHASLLVGNAFIVFGGDTKMDEGDSLDDTLYLLNTSTKQWSRALPAGPRPPGRYGHTLNILGSKIYIFGGQVEGYFFNDLVAFDLNALQQSTNRWEILIQNTIDGGPPHGQIPPARTNHTMVSWNDRLYLFGGTDGVSWFNDVWSYDPRTNSWTQLECIGYIPSPREGHAASLVGDVMYIFGGRTESGDDLGDLAAFRISSRRWYTFQNMGPSPSPRSGHSMTTVGKNVVILAGEPSSAPRDPVELGLAYFLDTSKIRYPPDSASQTPASERVQGTRRPSGEKMAGQPVLMGPGGGIGSQAGSRQGSAQGGGPAELMERQRVGSGEGRMRAESGSRLPRIAGPGQAPSPAPQGPPPAAPGQAPQSGPRVNGVATSRQPTRPPERALSPANEVSERARRFESLDINSPGARASPGPVEARMPTSPKFAPSGEEHANPLYFDNSEGHGEEGSSQNRQGSNGASGPYRKVETYQPSQDQSAEGQLGRSSSRSQSQQMHGRFGSIGGSDSRAGGSDMINRLDNETPRQSIDQQQGLQQQQPEQLPKVRQLQAEEGDQPQDSGIGSSPSLSQAQHDDIQKELDGLKSKNAWLASELALAKKSGYASRSSADSPVLDERAAEVFADDDRPLIEALLRMRSELSRVQNTIEEQAKNAAEKIGEMEKQRDTAVQEAVFAKARLAGQPSGDGSSARGTPDTEREGTISKKLAASLAAQSELSRKVEGLMQEIEDERKGRALAEDTAQAAEKRATELDQYRQQHSSEIETLRSELHDAQTQAREVSASHSEVSAQHQMLSMDKQELSSRLETALEEAKGHTGILERLREAVQSSTERAETLERTLEKEKGERGGLEQQLRQLRSEHESRGAELEGASSKLREAEEMAGKHREEARTHREAVLAGLGKINERNLNTTSAADERVGALQQQLESAHLMVRQNQAAADAASEKLRRAEERIAGLEAYQEQASREGLGIRKQLQQALKEHQTAKEERMQAEQKYQSQMLETNALAVQHASLKDILAERGINAAEVRKSRAMDSPSSLSNRFSAPDLHRVKELEQQLEASLKSHDEMKSQFEEVSERDEKMKREYEEKLTALDNDHQAAVKYLRGTEKMLSKMKQELQRVKNENGDLKKKVEKVGSRDGTPTGRDVEWEQEREKLKKEVSDAQDELKSNVSTLEGRINEMQAQLSTAQTELEQARTSHATSRADLSTLQATHTQTRGDIEKLQKENSLLEERARDAENKVQLLLDQVEHSVDNYRRQSRMAEGGNVGPNGIGAGAGHQRNLSAASSQATPQIGHSRNLSEGAESTYSDVTNSVAGGDDGRNSMALDSLATELDALRTHWETTNKNYRLSDKFDFGDRGHAAGSTAPGNGSGAGGLAEWRRGLEMEDEDTSRPTSSGGTIKGDAESEDGKMSQTAPAAGQKQGEAVSTPGGMI